MTLTNALDSTGPLGFKAAADASPAALGLAVLLKGGHAPPRDGRIADLLVVGKALYVTEKALYPAARRAVARAARCRR